MKKGLLLLGALVYSVFAFSQNKVNWTYTATKIKDRTYEIRVTASIEPGWFIYAQQQPENAISQPTEISFSKNPILAISGTPKEEGKLTIKKYKVLGYDANTYRETVAFVQTVTVKGNVRTNLDGAITYQVCNDRTCMPPATDRFSILLQ